MTALNTPMSYHRVNKIPLDDSSVFNSTADLMSYCKSGAWYNGQKVAVNLKYYTQTYTIRDSVPIIDLPPGMEWQTITKGSDIYALVYYHNTNKVYTTPDLYTLLKDPFQFIFMDSIAVFKDNNSLTFFIEKDVNGAVTSTSITQAEDPLTITSGTGKLYVTPSGSAAFMVGWSGGILMPRSDASGSIVRIYVKATKYFKAMGVI